MTFEEHIKQALGQLAWEALQARAKNDVLQTHCNDLGKALVEQQQAAEAHLEAIRSQAATGVANDTLGDRS